MYWKRFSGLVLCIGWLACTGVRAIVPEERTESAPLLLTVDELFRLGEANSLKLQADILDEAMAHERGKTARTSRLPDLQVGLRGGVVGQPIVFRHGLSDATYPDTPDWLQNYAIDFTQPLYEGGRIRYAVRRADLQTHAATLRTATDRADVKLDLLNQYMSLFSLYKQREVLMRNIEESERRLKDIRQMRKEGLITNNDVLRSEMQLTNDRLSLTETENSLVLVSQQLDILLGMDEDRLLLPDTSLLHRAVALQPYEEYVEEAYLNDPAMRLLRQQTEIARNEVHLTRADFLPSVSLYASNTLARPVSRTMADMYNNTWNFGLSVSYPISSLYKNNHRVKESKLAVEVARNAEEQQKQQARVTVRTAFLRHREALKQVEALKLSVRQAEENYRIMQNRYLNQLAILTDLLDANSVLLNAELQLTSARTQVIYTYYQLERACGRL